MITRRVLMFVLMLCQPIWLAAQADAPPVTMRVTTPDGTTQDISARESSVARLTLKDGRVDEFRPTIHDEPFSTVMVSIFKAATSTESTASVGELQATTGGRAVDSKSTPNFKVAIVNIEASPATKSS